MRRAAACLALVLTFAFAARAAADAPTERIKTIIVVRHAEAEPGPPGGDPQLGAAGRARALELARALADAPLRAVYSTHYARNRQTAEPLARRAGDRLRIIDDVTAILSALAAEPWGGTVLVVGHSNTVPKLLAGLVGRPIPESEPVRFDAMWIVALSRDGGASALCLHYGEAAP
ncbi:MAG TPA: phosphoglycerate mutase family protein [Haliangiales bacterium]|nr:phosphoglycerate mutase family protein [Haliangiales bacterium]